MGAASATYTQREGEQQYIEDQGGEVELLVPHPDSTSGFVITTLDVELTDPNTGETTTRTVELTAEQSEFLSQLWDAVNDDPASLTAWHQGLATVTSQYTAAK